MKRNNGKFEEDYRMPSYRTKERSMVVPFALGAIIGGIIGASLALLYAPAEGTELRQGLNETLDDLVGGAKDIIRGAKSAADKLFNEGLSTDEHHEDESPIRRTRERADDIIEDADRAIAEARRRTTSARSRREQEEEE